MSAHAGPISEERTTSRRVLDPIERSSEIMFGLIMALTFTCTISVATSTRADVTTMLAGALGCNIAWGFVDAAMYLLAQIVERERRRSFVTEVAAASPVNARRNPDRCLAGRREPPAWNGRIGPYCRSYPRTAGCAPPGLPHC